MALETATYINGLNTANPAATDPLSQADEHLRLIKSTIKATFPNVTGPVTKTQAQLNSTPAAAAITSNGSTPSLASGITAAEVKSLLAVSEPAIISNGSTPSLGSGITAAEVRNLVGAQDASTAISLLDVYPVGAIYTSVVSTSPASLFGGTWVAFAAGRVLVGINSSDGDFNQVEETGGAKTHTLSINEMPSHRHSITSGSGTSGGGRSADTSSSGATVYSNYEGGGAAHNNLQPYIVVYMWKRTAE